MYSDLLLSQLEKSGSKLSPELLSSVHSFSDLMDLSSQPQLSSDALKQSVIKSCAALVPQHPPLVSVSPQSVSQELAYTPKLVRWTEVDLPDQFTQLSYEHKESWLWPKNMDLQRIIQVHDFLYSRGQRYEWMSRDQANFVLYQAISEKDPVLASVYWAATQLFGEPYFRLPLKTDSEAGPEGLLLHAAPPVTNIATQCVMKLLRSEAEKLKNETELQLGQSSKRDQGAPAQPADVESQQQAHPEKSDAESQRAREQQGQSAL